VLGRSNRLVHNWQLCPSSLSGLCLSWKNSLTNVVSLLHPVGRSRRTRAATGRERTRSSGSPAGWETKREGAARRWRDRWEAVRIYREAKRRDSQRRKMGFHNRPIGRCAESAGDRGGRREWRDPWRGGAGGRSEEGESVRASRSFILPDDHVGCEDPQRLRGRVDGTSFIDQALSGTAHSLGAVLPLEKPRPVHRLLT
jgi:hypothetical protein